uniref:Uncharacterized protein n=1 Tax=Chromera velia CCMP2878 TaxID=1169474 RepID=A0A0G4GKE4_9ALVE|eukprot:Cvel_4827.t1-p1 / transcript=Cvel_4827.t1 / gene=Cvel_4827 / organism=Chromera_velia_CCMP2878 / gene_product=hypothetical protein / transcript_product=hypothetical protein / location=Cvel_scaffold217:79695-90995(+) / protein_length=336 / sequence_SO=supercontig / SO=protein_coding / is_pseudo=false
MEESEEKRSGVGARTSFAGLSTGTFNGSLLDESSISDPSASSSASAAATARQKEKEPEESREGVVPLLPAANRPSELNTSGATSISVDFEHLTDAVVEELPISQPVFLRNPDGSMAEGVPPGYKDKTPPRTPRRTYSFDTFPWLEDVDPSMVTEEMTEVYQRHERLFVTLLMLELVVEAAFNSLYIFYAQYSVREVAMVYHNLTPQSLWNIFYISFALEMVFLVAYYASGFAAVVFHKPQYLKMFSGVALFGILGQVILAYMNKFNLLVFFLRLMAYIYSKFLKNLLTTMQLLPSFYPNAQPNGAGGHLSGKSMEKNGWRRANKNGTDEEAINTLG